MIKIVVKLVITFQCIFCIAQTDTIHTIPPKYIVPIKNVTNQLVNEFSIIELKNRILDHNVIIIGENHGVHESTQIIKQITQIKQINHLITEIDSFSINYITKHKNNSKSLLQKMPGLYGMYSYEEDLELLNSLADSNTICHGVDLIHPATIRLILYKLSKSSILNDKTITAIKRLIESHSRDMHKGYLAAKTNKKTIKLLSKILKTCSELEKEYINYVFKYQYPSNFMEARAKYIIERTSYIFENNDLTNKNVLLKFGASHTLKTYNTSGFRDIGWYMDSISKQKLISPYFLTITPVSGVTGLPLKIDGNTSKKFDFNLKYNRHLKKFYNSLDKTTNSLFVDIRAFRKNLDSTSVISEELKYILDNYDGIIFIDQVTPSKIVTNKI
jgi:hypothetical protein